MVVADQAGSGKTLAYLVPLVQALKEEEEAQGGGRLTKPRRPRAVIICPTEELCVQVLYTARALSKVRPPAPPAATSSFRGIYIPCVVLALAPLRPDSLPRLLRQ